MTKSQKFCDNENPKRAVAVKNILTTVTIPGENFLVSLSLNKLDIIVQALIITDIIPA